MQEDAVDDETPDCYPRTKATVQMLLRDLGTMKKVAVIWGARSSSSSAVHPVNIRAFPSRAEQKNVFKFPDLIGSSKSVF